MDLYSITIMFRNSPNLVRLMFKNSHTADGAADILSKMPLSPNDLAEMKDDYGKVAWIKWKEFAGATYAHTNGELNAAQDEQILQAHAQIQLNKKVAADMILQAESKRQSIIQPLQPNGAMRQ